MKHNLYISSVHSQKNWSQIKRTLWSRLVWYVFDRAKGTKIPTQMLPVNIPFKSRGLKRDIYKVISNNRDDNIIYRGGAMKCLGC